MQNRTLRIIIGFGALICLAIFISAMGAKARTITVDDSGGKDYTTIQAAINASSPGDTVYVYNGVYNEQVAINKSITVTGESNQSTIIRGTNSYNSKGVYVTAGQGYVYISDLKVENFYSCIYLSSSNNTIVGNTATNCSYGSIYIDHGSNNTITGNTVTNCRYDIFLSSSSNNTITGNTITNCDGGIYLSSSLSSSSNNNIIRGNTITNCSGYGIYIISSTTSNNNITSNNIYGNKQYGLYSSGGSGNTAYNNWWGDASGPYNATANPNGKGDNITDGISFSPWVTAPFNIVSAIANQTNTNVNNQTGNQNNNNTNQTGNQSTNNQSNNQPLVNNNQSTAQNTNALFGIDSTTLLGGIGIAVVAIIVVVFLVIFYSGRKRAGRKGKQDTQKSEQTSQTAASSPPTEAAIEWGDTPAYKPRIVPCPRCKTMITISTPQRPIKITCPKCKAVGTIKR